MKTFIQLSVLALAATLSLTSCSKDEDNATPATSGNSLTMKVNGTSWSSMQMSSGGYSVPNASYTEYNGASIISVGGSDMSGNGITIAVTTTPGKEVTTFTGNTVTMGYVKDMGNNFLSPAQVIITKFDKVNGKISGTFTGNATGIAITEGKFTDVNLKKQ